MNYNHGPKFRDTFAFLGVFQFTRAQRAFPSPHKQCWARVSRIFSLYRVGEGKLQENFEKDALFYEGSGMTKNMNIVLLSQALLSMTVGSLCS